MCRYTFAHYTPAARLSINSLSEHLPNHSLGGRDSICSI